MRLALVFNPFNYKVHEENIRIVQKYFGLFPPLSISWVASIAEKAGHEVIIVDARTLELSKEETLSMLKEFRPDIMGFMMTTYMFQDTLQWIKYLKSHFKIPVVIGGYNLRVYPRESISHPEIDFGVVEQAYYTVPALLRELENQFPDFNNVPGLVYKINGQILITPHPQKIDFDMFPNPARHLLPNELYAEFPTERKNFTVMVTSLGCPSGCDFCEAGRTHYNHRSPQTVVNEMEECYYKFKIREIDIFDYQFTGIRNRVLEICRLIQEKKLDISWACRSRIDTVDYDMLSRMKESGCGRIYFGIESGDQVILDKIHKMITLKQVRDVLDMCRSLSIRTLGFFLIGAPGDTTKSIKRTVRFAKSLKLDYVQFSKCLAKPLTPLWKQVVTDTGQDYWKDWILGKETDRDLPRPWTTLSNKKIDTITKSAYISYYARPGFILTHFLNIRSFSELKRKLLCFIDMIFSQEKIAKADKDFRAFNENLRNRIISAKDKKYSENFSENEKNAAEIIFIRFPRINDNNAHPCEAVWPLSAGITATILKNKGYKVKIFDLQAKQKITLTQIYGRIASGNAKILFVQYETPSFSSGLSFSRQAKKINKDLIVVGFGQHARALAQEVIKDGGADICITTDPEFIVKDLMEAIEDGNLEHVSNIVYKDNQECVCVSHGEVADFNINSLPYMDLSLFDFEMYKRKKFPKPFFGGKRWGFIRSSLGCPYQCVFCSSLLRHSINKKYKPHSIEYIYNQIKYYKDKFGITVFSFEDDIFTIDDKRTIELCKAISPLNIRWVADGVRADHLSTDLLKAMKNSGCFGVGIGIESGSQRILDILRKNETVSCIRKNALAVKELGMILVGYVLIGSPTEAENDFKETINMINNIRPHVLYLHYFTPYPDSEAYKIYNDKIDLNRMNHYKNAGKNFSQIDSCRLKRLMKDFYKKYYFSSAYIKDYLKIRFKYLMFDFNEIILIKEAIRFLIFQ